MNTLTQQQIKQYQWQVADGVARIGNPFSQYTGYVKPVESGYMHIGYYDIEKIIDANVVATNAPDGIYSGEAFELVKQERLPFIMDEWDDYPFDVPENCTCEYRQFLRLKPSHLPAVLTTQPGEEWKDRYNEVWEFWSVMDDNWRIETKMLLTKDFNTYASKYPKIKTRQTWHLITPPAEQEAETVEQICKKALQNIDLNKFSCYEALQMGYTLCLNYNGEKWQKLQSTLTQKDQRIAELEQMLDQCQKGDLYFEQEIEHLNNRISELEKEREWISVEEFDESTLPVVGKSVIGIVDYMKCGIDKRDYIVCYMDEEKETRLLADGDYYGWDFDECIVKWTYLDMPLKPIF